jgi:hypothetical protein
VGAICAVVVRGGAVRIMNGEGEEEIFVLGGGGWQIDSIMEKSLFTSYFKLQFLLINYVSLLIQSYNNNDNNDNNKKYNKYKVFVCR